MNNGVNFAFLHGGGQGSWVWDATVAALALQDAAFGRAFALDVPGCGTKRGRDTIGIGPDAIAEELVADLAAAGMRDVVLVGHSQAGGILPRMAALRPDLFRRLVHVSCSIPLPGQTVLAMMGTGSHGSNPDEVGWPEGTAGEAPQRRYPAMFCNDMAAVEATTFLGRLGADNWPALSYAETNWPSTPAGVPVTYVLCLRDGILPIDWQERFAVRLGAERIVRIDAGHQVMNTRPHALAEALRVEAAR